MAARLEAMGSLRYRRGFDLTLHHDLIELPLRWRKPRTIFVNSMSDLFHEKVPVTFIRSVFATMAQASWHRFQILTKRADRLAAIGDKLSWQPNIWMGVSVENRQTTHRIDALRTVPAHVRFLSLEPLLEDLGRIDLAGISWVIVGGESGAGARPMDVDWVRSIRDQCKQSDTAFFFKQWGGVRKKAAGRRLDGRLWNDMP
jgi:protein gp37